MSSAVLCSDFLDPNLVAAGTFQRVLSVYDYRAQPQPALTNTFHQAAVLCLKSPYSLAGGGALASSCATSTTLNFSDGDSMVSSVCDLTQDEGSIAGEEAKMPAGDASQLPTPSQNVACYSGSKDGIIAAWDLRQFSRPVAQHRVSVSLYTYYLFGLSRQSI